jgi:hypothetical protein
MASNHKKRARKSVHRKDVELASVRLGMESRVDAPWDGLAGPDAYITDLDGEILIPGEEDESEIVVGTVSGYSVHLSQADDCGYSWFEVLDARNADIALYADLIDVEESCYTDWVQSTFEPFGGDLLILDRIRIEPDHRGEAMACMRRS